MYNGYYHCRLCGENFKACYTNSEERMWNYMLQLRNSMIKTEELERPFPGKNAIHCCNDGSVGLADFIGFRREED